MQIHRLHLRSHVWILHYAHSTANPLKCKRQNTTATSWVDTSWCITLRDTFRYVTSWCGTCIDPMIWLILAIWLIFRRYYYYWCTVGLIQFSGLTWLDNQQRWFELSLPNHMHSTEPLPKYVKTFCWYITPKRTDSEVYRRRRRGRGWGGGRREV